MSLNINESGNTNGR